MDEPNADSSCAPTFLVSQLARKSVTVALTGDGADELFAGYGRYLACVTATAGREEDIQARRWHIGREYYSRHSMLFDDQDICQFFGFLPSHAADAILQRRRRIDLDVRPVIHRLREADVETYMPVVLAKVDRMSMLHSLETRTPYLSPEIANFAARLPVSFLYNDVYGKLVLRKVMSRYFPIDFVDRPKKGFGIDSFHATALPALLRRVERELSPPDCALASYVPHEKVLHFIRNCLPTMTVYHSWAVLILELWLRSHPNKPTFENSLMDS
jgi:asparagine synthase (glutamine-hydrolysing)